MSHDPIQITIHRPQYVSESQTDFELCLTLICSQNLCSGSCGTDFWIHVTTCLILNRVQLLIRTFPPLFFLSNNVKNNNLKNIQVSVIQYYKNCLLGQKAYLGKNNLFEHFMSSVWPEHHLKLSGKEGLSLTQPVIRGRSRCVGFTCEELISMITMQ